jgi:hypothetical protein
MEFCMHEYDRAYACDQVPIQSFYDVCVFIEAMNQSRTTLGMLRILYAIIVGFGDILSYTSLLGFSVFDDSSIQIGKHARPSQAKPAQCVRGLP